MDRRPIRSSLTSPAPAFTPLLQPPVCRPSPRAPSLTATPSPPSPNTLADGIDAELRIEIAGSPTVVGLKIDADACTIRGLVINRFTFNPGDSGTPQAPGIFVLGGNNFIEGNFIGTDPTGTAALQNTWGILVYGVGNRIGGTSPAQRNLISGNGAGVIGQHATVEGNFIGTDRSGTVARRKTLVELSQRDDRWRTCACGGNLSPVTTPASTSKTRAARWCRGYRIGTDASGLHSIGNTEVGISVWATG